MFIVNVLGRAHVRGAKVWVTAYFFLRRSGVMDFMRHRGQSVGCHLNNAKGELSVNVAWLALLCGA
jgi:hypothetical protein